jgi:hypothetical protein
MKIIMITVMAAMPGMAAIVYLAVITIGEPGVMIIIAIEVR